MDARTVFDHIIVESGQYILANNSLELNYDRFKLLVERVLVEYANYKPIIDTFNIHAPDRSYAFNGSETKYGVIPERVLSVNLISYSGANVFLANAMRNGFDGFSTSNRFGNSAIRNRVQVPFQYRYGTLYLASSGYWDVRVMYPQFIESKQQDNGSFTFELKGITLQDTLFFELLKGSFLMALGKSRRAFTLNDMPITMDADSLAGDGKEIYDTALERLHQRSYLPLGG